MSLQFTKMHGLGNDFMVIDGIHQKIHLLPEQIAAMSRRDTGVGFDQCLVVEASPEDHIDFVYRIFNADGQEVGQCGNGARCLARFVRHYGLTDQDTITVQTKTSLMRLHINHDKTVTVNMGKPKLSPNDIPLLCAKQAPLYAIPLENDTVSHVHAVNVGNPHAIVVVPDVDHADVSGLGLPISQHPYFPEQTNVGFMQIISPHLIQLRVYERGCGETKACGSGAVAAVVSGRLFHDLSDHVTVSLPGGALLVTWPSVHDEVSLTGPATFIYEGTLGINGSSLHL